MKLKTSPGVLISTGLSVTCAAITAVAQVTQNLQSSRATDGRAKALQTIAQHVLSESCTRIAVNDGFKIGYEIKLEGTGKSPTACFINRKNQFGFAGYLNGKFQVLYVFSPKEVWAKRSQIKQESR